MGRSKRAAVRAIVGPNLRRLREARGLTQQALGDAIGVTDGNVSGWEAGTISVNADYIPDLARILGVEVGAFYAPLEGQSPGSTRAGKVGRTRQTSNFVDTMHRRLMADWEQLPTADQDAILAIADILSEYRARLLGQEHDSEKETAAN